VDSRGTPGLAEDPTGHTQLLAERAGIVIPHIDEARRHTDSELQRVRSALAAEELPDTVSVCVFGSWARDELTPSSDHDWAILTADPINEGDPDPAVLKAHEVAGRYLGGDDHAPGSQATFGVPFDVHTLVNKIGLEGDTNSNLTRRMLLLLESRALTGPVHAAGWNEVLNRYMNYGIKDYRPPRFLLNDLTRYWRTICVDFEGKHLDTEGHDPKWVTRNAKLRTSRKLLFAGGLIPILLCHLHDTDAMPGFLARWLAATPLDRLCAAYVWAGADSEGARALTAYDRWLAIQLDPQARGELRSLTLATRRESPLFSEIAEIGRQLERALLVLLFEPPLAELSRQYLVF
jgi:predicted nucleotidyltransferase